MTTENPTSTIEKNQFLNNPNDIIEEIVQAAFALGQTAPGADSITHLAWSDYAASPEHIQAAKALSRRLSDLKGNCLTGLQEVTGLMWKGMANEAVRKEITGDIHNVGIFQEHLARIVGGADFYVDELNHVLAKRRVEVS